MHRFPGVLVVAVVAAAVGAGLAACSSEGGSGGEATVTSPASGVVTTTSPAPVPGPADTTIDVPAPVAERWTQLGGVAGDLGRAAGPATDVEGGSVTEFERGWMVLTPAGRVFVVQGEILSAYREAGGPAGELGFPTSDETTTDGGWISVFEGGTIAFLDGRPGVEGG